jgi:hypothetical protein
MVGASEGLPHETASESEWSEPTMSLLSGSISTRRYRVLAQPPMDWREWYEKTVRAHALVPIDPESGSGTEKSIGWCSIFDEQDLDLSFSKFHLDGYILLSLRIDTLKPPRDEVKRLLKQRQREIEAERKEPLSASALRELKDMIVIDLRRRTPPKTKTVDVLWDMEAQKLTFMSHSKAMNEAFLRLFAETFNLGLDIEGPGFWAHGIAETLGSTKQLSRTRPTIELLGGFVGLRPCPRSADVRNMEVHNQPSAVPEDTVDAVNDAMEDRRYLGREFLTWLIFKARGESDSDCIFLDTKDTDAFRIAIGERVTLKALGEGTGEIVARGAAPAQTADVRYAIAGGLTVREVEILIEQNDRLWMASISAEGFDMRRVKLPSLLSEEDDERVHERIELLGEVDKMLKAAFAEFMKLRLSAAWTAEELPKMRGWLKESINVEESA